MGTHPTSTEPNPTEPAEVDEIADSRLLAEAGVRIGMAVRGSMLYWLVVPGCRTSLHQVYAYQLDRSLPCVYFGVTGAGEPAKFSLPDRATAEALMRTLDRHFGLLPQ